jgi:hypothetical protein
VKAYYPDANIVSNILYLSFLLYLFLGSCCLKTLHSAEEFYQLPMGHYELMGFDKKEKYMIWKVKKGRKERFSRLRVPQELGMHTISLQDMDTQPRLPRAAVPNHGKNKCLFQIPFTNSVMRLLPEQPSDFIVKAKDHILHVQAQTPHNLSYHVVARLFSGKKVPIASFSAKTDEQNSLKSLESWLTIFYSPSGTHVVVHHFFNTQEESIVLFNTEEEDPIGHTNVGYQRVNEIRDLQNANTYQRIHPNTRFEYDQFIKDK